MDHRPKVRHEKCRKKEEYFKTAVWDNFFCVFVIWTTPQNTDNKTKQRNIVPSNKETMMWHIR